MVEKRINLILQARDRTKGMMGRLGGSLAGFASKLATVGAVGVTAAGAGLALLTARAFESIDAMAKLSDRTGISTEALAGLQHAADITGAGGVKMSAALDVMQKRLGEAGRGSGAAVKALDELGLSAADLINLSPDEQFKRIAEAISKLPTQAQKAAATANIFSRANQGLVNTLSLGRDGLNKMSSEANKLGLSFSRVDAAKVEEANDAVTRMQAAFTGIGRRVAVAVAPMVQTFADGVAGMTAEMLPVIESTIGAITNALQGTGQSISSWVMDGIRWVGDFATTLVEFFNNFASHAEIGALTAAKYFVDLKDKVFNVFENLGGRIGHFFVTAFENILFETKAMMIKLGAMLDPEIMDAFLFGTKNEKRRAEGLLAVAIKKPMEELKKGRPAEIPFVAKELKESDAAKALGAQIATAQGKLAKDAAARANRIKDIQGVKEKPPGGLFDSGTDAERKAARTSLAGVGDLFAPDEVKKASRSPLEALSLSAGFTGLASRFRAGEEPAAKTTKNTEKANTELTKQTDYLRRIAEVSRSSVGLPVFA